MAKKKIVFLSRYLNTVHRGAETYVLELSKRLQSDFDVTVLSGQDSDSLKKILAAKPDIVIPTNGRWQALVASFGRLLASYKVVISGQAGIGRDDLWNLLLRPDVYVGITSFESDWARQFSFGVKLAMIHNGVDLNRFAQSKPISLPLKKPIILSVGALYWYKHHERTIQAVSKLPNCSLLIVGDGAERANLEKLGTELLGPDRFKIMTVNFADIPPIYKSCDLFVLPSWNRESFGIVYVEAMASNLPIVAPNDPPRQEIVADAGILTDVEDSEKYAEAIKQALSKNWGDKPLKQAKKFDWDLIAQQYSKLLKDLTA